MAKDEKQKPRMFIMMGVSGSGKTTIGKALAKRLGYEFCEGDTFHSKECIAKLSNGIPLTDEDRLPWLRSMNQHMREQQNHGMSAVYSCSALKKAYRVVLTMKVDDAYFVYLRISHDVVKERLETRKGHFMQSRLLHSQFNDLEEPEDAIIVNSHQEVSEVVQSIVELAGV